MKRHFLFSTSENDPELPDGAIEIALKGAGCYIDMDDIINAYEEHFPFGCINNGELYDHLRKYHKKGYQKKFWHELDSDLKYLFINSVEAEQHDNYPYDITTAYCFYMGNDLFRHVGQFFRCDGLQLELFSG